LPWQLAASMQRRGPKAIRELGGSPFSARGMESYTNDLDQIKNLNKKILKYIYDYSDDINVFNKLYYYIENFRKFDIINKIHELSFEEYYSNYGAELTTPLDNMLASLQ